MPSKALKNLVFMYFVSASASDSDLKEPILIKESAVPQLGLTISVVVSVSPKIPFPFDFVDATLYPARKASRLNPTDILRYA